MDDLSKEEPEQGYFTMFAAVVKWTLYLCAKDPSHVSCGALANECSDGFCETVRSETRGVEGIY